MTLCYECVPFAVAGFTPASWQFPETKLHGFRTKRKPDCLEKTGTGWS